MLYNKKIFHNCFCYPKRYWYLNIRNIPRYFKRMHHLIKYGYDDYALWDTFSWFIETMHEILIRYKCDHVGHPILDLTVNAEENEKLWEAIIDKMILYLDNMDETNEKYISVSRLVADRQIEQAKDEFFSLFSKYFYNLWD